jgi:hypothetical protein
MSPAVAVALSPRAGIGDHQWQFPFAQRESESMFACSHYGGFGRQHEVDAGEHNAPREVDGAGEDNQEVEPTIKVYRPEPGIFALYRLGEVPKISSFSTAASTTVTTIRLPSALAGSGRLDPAAQAAVGQTQTQASQAGAHLSLC